MNLTLTPFPFQSANCTDHELRLCAVDCKKILWRSNFKLKWNDGLEWNTSRTIKIKKYARAIPVLDFHLESMPTWSSPPKTHPVPAVYTERTHTWTFDASTWIPTLTKCWGTRYSPDRRGLLLWYRMGIQITRSATVGIDSIVIILVSLEDKLWIVYSISVRQSNPSLETANDWDCKSDCQAAWQIFSNKTT